MNHNEMVVKLYNSPNAIKEIIESNPNFKFESAELGCDKYTPEDKIINAAATDLSRNQLIIISMNGLSIQDIDGNYLPNYPSSYELLAQNEDARKLNSAYVKKMNDLFGSDFTTPLLTSRKTARQLFQRMLDKKQFELDVYSESKVSHIPEYRQLILEASASVKRQKYYIGLMDELIKEIQNTESSSERS